MRENKITITTQQEENSGSGGHFRHSRDGFWWSTIKSLPRSTAVLLFPVVLIIGALLYTLKLDTQYLIRQTSSTKSVLSTTTPHETLPLTVSTQKPIEIPLNCNGYNLTRTCPTNNESPIEENNQSRRSSATCPEYFRWIDEDLRPWAHTGITKEMVERGKETANFKLVVLKGRAYLETYEKSFQTRDVFTIWGILQLLRRYPGKIPDLELMFDCVDWPVVLADRYNAKLPPPPLFRYCGNDATFDIVFPDWSYWGWAEVNIKPWEILLEELKEGNKRIPWLKREPYAYWKGNPAVAETRQDLMKCNVSQNQDWNARLYAQNWGREAQEGYKKSDLASQCTHRYKVYIEGSAWSVSLKYILGCDSTPLIVKPHYYDFFTRGLIPVHHYWPIKEDDKCRSIKFAVDWGNSHNQKAHLIGKGASDFIQEEVKMDYVYDYMFHLLNSYAKLFRYKPSLSANATEICVESMVCEAEGSVKKFMMESLVKFPANTDPCTMPPPFDPPSLHEHLKRKESLIQQVDLWEKSYWENQTIKS